MKNIAYKKTNRNNQDATAQRIERITRSFKTSSKGNQAQMLERLKYEASFTQDLAVRNWLIRFESNLKAMGGK